MRNLRNNVPRPNTTVANRGLSGQRRSSARFSHLILAAMSATALGTACVPDPGPSTQLTVTTLEQFCGGAYNPDVPPCSTGPVSRSISVSLNGSTVASGTSNAQGTLTLAVPAGPLVVEAVGTEPYMNCDTPEVVSVAGATTAVTQTCSIFAP